MVLGMMPMCSLYMVVVQGHIIVDVLGQGVWLRGGVASITSPPKVIGHPLGAGGQPQGLVTRLPRLPTPCCHPAFHLQNCHLRIHTETAQLLRHPLQKLLDTSYIFGLQIFHWILMNHFG